MLHSLYVIYTLRYSQKRKGRAFWALPLSSFENMIHPNECPSTQKEIESIGQFVDDALSGINDTFFREMLLDVSDMVYPIFTEVVSQ